MNRRQKLEALVQEDPDDVFLRYALAMQCVSDGDDDEGLDGLQKLLERDAHYVPAYFQTAQLLAKKNELETCRHYLTRGIEVAHEAGDSHAEGEMRGFLEQLG